jgi:hypothetical protein
MYIPRPIFSREDVRGKDILFLVNEKVWGGSYGCFCSAPIFLKRIMLVSLLFYYSLIQHID